MAYWALLGLIEIINFKSIGGTPQRAAERTRTPQLHVIEKHKAHKAK